MRDGRRGIPPPRSITVTIGAAAGHGTRGPQPVPSLLAGARRLGPALVRPRRAPQPPAAPAAAARGAVGAMPHRGGEPLPEGRPSATGAHSLRHVMAVGSAGRHRRAARLGSPRGGAFHGLHNVEETRARHDAPSPGRLSAVRGGAPPCRTEQEGVMLIPDQGAEWLLIPDLVPGGPAGWETNGADPAG